MTNLIILSKEIRQSGGLFSLNDLHKASGGESKNKPSNFLRLETTRNLIKEISNCSDLSNYTSVVLNKGRYGGTYVCIELAIAYAAWINAAFHLKVLHAFLELRGYSSSSDHSGDRQTYHYPRRLLEQYGYSSEGRPAKLHPMMLADTKGFSSPLHALLNDLHTNGNDVGGPMDEFDAMREAIIEMSNTLEQIYLKAIRATAKPASTASRNKN